MAGRDIVVETGRRAVAQVKRRNFAHLYPHLEQTDATVSVLVVDAVLNRLLGLPLLYLLRLARGLRLFRPATNHHALHLATNDNNVIMVRDLKSSCVL